VSRCRICPSYAINPSHHGRDETDQDLCDVCYWRTRAPQWQPIETAPKDGRPLLLDHPDWHTRVLRGGWDAHEQAWRAHGFGCPATQPSHWHPLPGQPEVIP